MEGQKQEGSQPAGGWSTASLSMAAAVGAGQVWSRCAQMWGALEGQVVGSSLGHALISSFFQVLVFVRSRAKCRSSPCPWGPPAEQGG